MQYQIVVGKLFVTNSIFLTTKNVSYQFDYCFFEILKTYLGFADLLQSHLYNVNIQKIQYQKII